MSDQSVCAFPKFLKFTTLTACLPEQYKSLTMAMASLYNHVSLSLGPSSGFLTTLQKKHPTTLSFAYLTISKPAPSQHSYLICANLPDSKIASVNSFVFSIGGIQYP